MGGLARMFRDYADPPAGGALVPRAWFEEHFPGTAEVLRAGDATDTAIIVAFGEIVDSASAIETSAAVVRDLAVSVSALAGTRTAADGLP